MQKKQKTLKPSLSASAAPRDNNLTTGKVYESVIKKEGVFVDC